MTRPAAADRPVRRTGLLALVVTASLLLAACTEESSPATPPTSTPPPSQPGTTTAAAPTSDLVFPGTDWPTATAEEAGIDQAALDSLTDFLADAGSNCMTVVKDGRLVTERYWNGFDPSTTQEMFSATKSMSSTLVGIADDQGLLDIDEPASTYLTEWTGTPSEAVTIRNLLSNDSGRYWSLLTDYREMITSPDKTGFSIGLEQQFPPGEEWEYNNSAIQTLEAVLERATGRDVGEFADDNLFDPIGMDAELRRDASGNVLTFMGAQTSCRGLARFGLLFLAGGRWGDRQVVSADWVTEATSPSTDLNNAYGFLWWLNRPGVTEQPGREGVPGPIWRDLPESSYAAIGLGNQVVLVIPDEGLVITRAGQGRGQIGSQGDLVNEMGRLVLAGMG